MEEPVIGIVGPCAAGKSTLITGLRQRGFRAKHIAQEHSYVPDMWSRLSHPDVLVYLDVTHEVSLERRISNITIAEFEEQLFRLRDARVHADIYIDTTSLSINDVLDAVINYLSKVVGQSD